LKKQTGQNESDREEDEVKLEERTEVIIIPVLPIDCLRPILVFAVDAKDALLATVIVKVDTSEMIVVPLEIAILITIPYEICCWKAKRNAYFVCTSWEVEPSPPLRSNHEWKGQQREDPRESVPQWCATHLSPWFDRHFGPGPRETAPSCLRRSYRCSERFRKTRQILLITTDDLTQRQHK
jgi:hypothetical protein